MNPRNQPDSVANSAKDSPSLRALALAAAKVKPKNVNVSVSTPRLTVDFGALAYWFFPVVGAIYAAGYLIVVIFAKDYGIDGTELLQAKYVHVGSLFLFNCLVLLLPLFWALLGLIRIWALFPDLTLWPRIWKVALGVTGVSEMVTNEWTPRLPGIVTYASMFIASYAVLAFSERPFFIDHALLVLSIIIPPMVLTIFGLLPSEICTDRNKRRLIGLTGACAAVLLCCILSRPPLWATLKSVALQNGGPTGADGFAICMLLIALYVLFSRLVIKNRPSATSRAAIVLSCTSVVGLLLYLSLLGFAYAVYPFIPVSRGGGGYINATPIMLSLKHSGLPTSVETDITSEHSTYVIVYQNSSSLFVASTTDNGGPSNWQVSKKDNKPVVYEIPRTNVLSVGYLNGKIDLTGAVIPRQSIY